MALTRERCPEALHGEHMLADAKGRCRWCGQQYVPALSMPRIDTVSDLTEAYGLHYDPDWGVER